MGGSPGGSVLSQGSRGRRVGVREENKVVEAEVKVMWDHEPRSTGALESGNGQGTDSPEESALLTP